MCRQAQVAKQLPRNAVYPEIARFLDLQLRRSHVALHKITHPAAHSGGFGLEFEKHMYGMVPRMGFEDVAL